MPYNAPLHNQLLPLFGAIRTLFSAKHDGATGESVLSTWATRLAAHLLGGVEEAAVLAVLLSIIIRCHTNAILVY